MSRWGWSLIVSVVCFAVALPVLLAAAEKKRAESRKAPPNRTPVREKADKGKGDQDERKSSKKKRADKSPTSKPTSKPSSKRGPALLIDKVYGMVMDTKPAKTLIPRIDVAFEETRLKVATLEGNMRRDRGWIKARIEQEIDVLVLLVEDLLPDDKRERLRKAYSQHKSDIPSARRRRERSGTPK